MFPKSKFLLTLKVDTAAFWSKMTSDEVCAEHYGMAVTLVAFSALLSVILVIEYQ